MKRIGSGIQPLCSAAAIAAVSALMTVSALAASPRLDEANAHLKKAEALLKAAGEADEARNVRVHRERGIRLIEQAEREIALTKRAAAAPKQDHSGAPMTVPAKPRPVRRLR